MVKARVIVAQVLKVLGAIKKSSKKVVLTWMSIKCFLAGVTSEFLLMFFVSASERYSSTVLNFVLQKAATRKGSCTIVLDFSRCCNS